MIFEELKDSEQNSEVAHLTKVDSTSNISTQEVFSLLEERLILDLTRRKIGEVVIRKEIETQIVQMQVPVRREKLIVEQVSPEYKLLAEINLGQANTFDRGIADQIGDNLTPVDNDEEPISFEPISFELDDLGQKFNQTKIHGSFYSPEVARDLLNDIASLPGRDCQTIQVEIVLKDSRDRDIYQALFDRYCQD